MPLRAAALPQTATHLAALVGGAFAAGYQAFAAHATPSAAGVFAVALAATIGLVVGCVCGLGWGLLLGSSSPKLAGHLAPAGAAVAAAAAAAAAPPVQPAARAAAPRSVQAIRRPGFLLEEA